jgi:hypothetical protein
MRVRGYITTALFVALATAAAAQTETLCGPDASADRDKTLGEFARFVKKSPASHAKVVLNDDNLTPRPPIPDIALDEEINDKQISDAFALYSDIHTRSDIDRTVHEWYDAQVAAFERLRDEVAHIQNAQSAYYPSYYYPGESYDPEKAREQAWIAQAGQQVDQRTMQRDNEQMQRMNTALTRLRFVFDPTGTRYAWFLTTLNPYQR